MTKLSLWKILVPTHYNSESKIEVEHHKVWDKFVQNNTNGLTINKPSKGIWVSGNDTTYEETMIPVEIACTENEIEKIIEFTAKHYKQIAVFCAEISPNVKLYNYDTEEFIRKTC